MNGISFGKVNKWSFYPRESFIYLNFNCFSILKIRFFWNEFKCFF
nr:MAG TPA: hypothetical protein [Caudoviricetes sp.]